MATTRIRPIKRGLAVLALLGSLVFVGMAASEGPAFAATTSNFVATGHDMDYHCSGGSTDECDYLQILVTKVRNGSSLPVLALDNGSQVGTALTNIGVPFTSVDPNDLTALNAVELVNGSGVAQFSALITASDSNCGGCDNDATSSANINTRTADIKEFFNAGGGILALAGSGQPGYYDFVPFPDVNAVAVSGPFTVEPAGVALGITDAMANCCATHNSFTPPPSPFVMLESDSADNAETIAAFDVVIGTGFETTTTTIPGETTTTAATIPPTVPPTVPETTTTTSTTMVEETTTTVEETTTTVEEVIETTAPPETDGGVSGESGGQGGLARTGTDLAPIVALGSLLLVAGAAILMARRRLEQR